MTAWSDGLLRPIEPHDVALVLAWNQADVDLLAPLDAEGLVALQDEADTAAVILLAGEPAGFVVTFASGATYGSANYRWFSQRHEEFVYLDRIVLVPFARRQGLGTMVYDALEADAAERVSVFCLEVNTVPPNEPSLAFHAQRGYREVGRQHANGHEVALLEKPLR